MTPTPTELYAAIDKTWPAAEIMSQGGWCFRKGLGGGKRVSAATIEVVAADISFAEAHMRAMDQTPLFMIRDKDQTLDAALAQRGYQLIDRVSLMIKDITSTPFPANVDIETEPTQMQKQIWSEGGINASRINIMKRAYAPSAFISISNKATSFVSIANRIAMSHAVEVRSTQRRQGLGAQIMAANIAWAHQQGARFSALLTVYENKPAMGLYAKLGYVGICDYHYRIKI